MQFDQLKRREFITLIGGAALWALAARAQESEMSVIGFLHAGSAAEGTQAVASFQKGLGEADYVEDRNVVFELRWADGQFDRLPGLAADLAGRKVAVIAAFGNASSLNRPGGNVTGVSILNQELESTRLERLVEVVPHATTIAFLVNPESLTADPKLREMENTARMFNRHLQVLNARNESEFEQVFVTVEQQRIGAMVVTSDTMFSNESATLGRVSARHTGAYDGSLSRFHERRRVDELRQRLGRCLSSRGSLRGANSQRRSAARSAGYAIHQSRVCHQYENR